MYIEGLNSYEKKKSSVLKDCKGLLKISDLEKSHVCMKWFHLIFLKYIDIKDDSR